MHLKLLVRDENLFKYCQKVNLFDYLDRVRIKDPNFGNDPLDLLGYVFKDAESNCLECVFELRLKVIFSGGLFIVSTQGIENLCSIELGCLTHSKEYEKCHIIADYATKALYRLLDTTN